MVNLEHNVFYQTTILSAKQFHDFMIFFFFADVFVSGLTFLSKVKQFVEEKKKKKKNKVCSVRNEEKEKKNLPKKISYRVGKL